MKKAHEKLLNLRKHIRYKDDVLSLNRSELVGEITKSLAIEVLYAVLTRGELLLLITEDAGNLTRRTLSNMKWELNDNIDCVSSNFSLSIANAILVQLSKTFG